MKVVVVGGSLAGLRTVEALRRRGFDGEIVVLEGSSDLPYDRPPLSKEFILGHQPPDISLATCDAMEALAVRWRLDWRAVRLDTGNRCVIAADGAQESYDRLVIATGSHPKRFPGSVEAGCLELRSIDDARRLRERLAQAETAGVVGGGFIGTEVAATARARGLDVTLLEAMPSLLLRGLPGIGYLVERLHRRNGVNVIVNAGRVDVEPARHGTRVRLADGTTRDFDVVVSGIGCRPTTDWLDGSGLQIDDGIVCDATMQARATSDVFAAGDVARWYHPLYERTVRLEHWSAAQDHADVIAASICGEPRHCDAVPFVWSEQFGHRIQVAGLVTDDVRLHVLEHDETTDRCVAVYERDGMAVAAIAVDDPKRFGRMRRLLASGGDFEALAAAVA